MMMKNAKQQQKKHETMINETYVCIRSDLSPVHTYACDFKSPREIYTFCEI